MKFFFIIPAYEPDFRIIEVIKQILAIPKAHICVVDDGSQNKLIFKDPLLQNERISLLEHAVNLGKGAALKTAFNYVLTHFPNVKAVVTLDADGQHAVQDALEIAKQVHTKNVLILGTRSFPLSNQKIPLKSRLGNVLTRFVWRLFIGSKITDTQTGLRGIPSSLMKDCLHILPNRYEFEMEMLIKASEMHIPVEEISIETIYINQNRGTHFNPFFDSLKIYFVLFRFSFSAFISTIIDYISFYISFSFFSVGFSFILARLVSFSVNYTLNKNFVFRKKKGEIRFSFKISCSFLCESLYRLRIH